MLLRPLLFVALFLAVARAALCGDVLLRTYPLAPAEVSARGYIFSGNAASFFFGTTATLRTNPFMGLTVENERLFDDMRLWHNGRLFDRAAAKADFWAQGVSFSTDSVTFILDMALRNFTRIIALPDRLQGLSLELLFAPGALDERRAKHYTDALTIAPPVSGKYFLAIAWPSAEALQGRSREVSPGIPDSLYSFEPFYGALRHHTLLPNWVITYGTTEEEALEAARRLLSDRGAAALARRNALRSVLSRSELRTSDSTVARALLWAKKSLVDLQAAADTELSAGFPWFAEAWGRDTFISLPGAFLVTGNYDAARVLLLKFARWQDKDSTSRTFGRIPERVRPDEIVYNSADATPWWIRDVYEYGLYSGDWELWEKLVGAEPSFKRGHVEGAVRLALRGALSRMDSLGFVCHGEAGLGEFRAVEPQARRWVGGGGDGTCRVYDSAFWPER